VKYTVRRFYLSAIPIFKVTKFLLPQDFFRKSQKFASPQLGAGNR
jgi:hypothetical protein